jgi:hypothetical protein
MGRGALEVALALGAISLDLADLVHGLLELAGEPLIVHAESGEGAAGLDDVKVGAVFGVNSFEAGHCDITKPDFRGLARCLKTYPL